MSQAEKRDQLIAELKRNHPDFKPTQPGYEYWFRDAEPLMTPEATNHDLAAGDGPFAKKLSQLQRHLEGWFVKYNEVFLDEPGRALVYLADEDNLGPGFPHDLDAYVEAAYADADAKASAES